MGCLCINGSDAGLLHRLHRDAGNHFIHTCIPSLIYDSVYFVQLKSGGGLALPWTTRHHRLDDSTLHVVQVKEKKKSPRNSEILMWSTEQLLRHAYLTFTFSPCLAGWLHRWVAYPRTLLLQLGCSVGGGRHRLNVAFHSGGRACLIWRLGNATCYLCQ
jgi:hypothetical protein